MLPMIGMLVVTMLALWWALVWMLQDPPGGGE